MSDRSSLFRNAVSALDRGQFSIAEQQLRNLLEFDANHLGALNLLAVATLNLGRYDEAEAAIQRALKLNKRDANSLTILAMIFKSQGRSEQALEKLDRALRLDPKNLRALNNRGTLLKDLGRYDPAIKDFDAALAIDRSYVAANYNKAGALAAQGRHDRALTLYEEILRASPTFAPGWIGCGLAQMDLGLFDKAMLSFSTAIEQDANDPNGHFNHGNALLRSGRAEEALASYDRAVTIEPGFVDAQFNRAEALRALSQFEAAARAYRQVIRLKPDHFEAANNLGGVLTELLLLDEAIAAFDASIRNKPDYANALYNKSVPILLRGEFAEGWALYEQRKRKTVPLGARSFKQPLWLGDHVVSGKTVLIHWEQGLGDTIQFCRYVKMLENAGARVLFAPQKSLRELMKGLDVGAELVDAEGPASRFDFHCPLLSLPLAFRTRLDTIPAQAAYLKTDAARVENWRRRLGEGFKIGVCWRGSAFGASVGRSASRALFAGIRGPGVRFFSLQKPDFSEAAPQDGIEELGPDFDAGSDAFLDAAAVIQNLDLVISVDTAIAHLAGALGARVWIVLKRSPDWRWMLDRSDSPWYPSARLFRQRAIGDWSSCLLEVAAALEREIPAGAQHHA